MAYLGSSNSLYDPTRVTPTTVQTFNGDGVTTQFTLQYSILQSIDIEVLVENVVQQPDYAYSAVGNVITFTTAPPPGTNNIYVRFGKVTGLTGTVPDGSVTSSKLSNNIRLLATDMYTGTGSQTAFNLSDTPADANSLIVSVNGVAQAAPSNYTVSGSTITFTSAPASGANVVIRNVGFRTTQTLYAFPSGTQMVQPVITGGNISNATLANTSFTGSFAQSNAINGYDAFSATRAGRTFCWGLDVSGNYGIWDTTTSVNNRLLIDSSGNVGIGTSSPGYRLEVSYGSTSDALVITGSVDNTTPYLSFKSSNGGTSYIRARIRGAAPDSTNGGLVFETGTSGSTSERMRLDSSGNLGIGTSSPSSYGKFVVADNTSFVWNIGSNNTASATIGIPTTGTSTSFAISLPTHNTYYPASFYITGSHNGSTNVTTAELHAVGVKYSAWGSNIAFFTSSGTAEYERMRLDSTGNLMVGTTTASARLAVVSSADVTYLQTTGSTSTCGYAKVPGNTAYYWLWQNSAGSNIAYIRTTDGTTVTYNTGSDVRLKENIVDSKSSLQKINNIKVREFSWKSTGKKVEFGFIAQELNSVAPEAVSQGKDNVDGTIDVPWGVDNSVLVPALVKAIQELSEKVDTLQTELNQLKGAK